VNFFLLSFLERLSTGEDSFFDIIASRPLQNGTLCPISASGSNFNPRNIQYIPVVEIFAFLELEHKLPFFKGLASLEKLAET